MPDIKTHRPTGRHAIRCAVMWSEKLHEAKQYGFGRETFDELRKEWEGHFTNALLMDAQEVLGA